MDLATVSLNAVPPGGIVPLVLWCAIGLVLWAAGRRVLRAGLAAIGVLVGFALGWVGGVEVPLTVSPWIPAIIGAAVLGCLAVLAYRIAVAGALAVVLGIASPLVVLTLGPGLHPAKEAEETPIRLTTPLEEVDEFTAWLRSYDDHSTEPLTNPIVTPEAAEQMGLSAENQARLDRMQRTAIHLGEEAQGWWAEAPREVRSRVLFAAAVGALLGILLGTLAPHACASGVTAFGGSLLWMGSARLLLADVAPDAAQALPQAPAIWLGIWLGVAFIGLAIQWMIRRPHADKAA